MITNFFTTDRIAGFLLLLSGLLLLVGFGLIAAQGRMAGMAAAFRGVGPPIRDASGLRTIAGFAIPSLMAQLAGFTLFALLLHQAGDRGLALVALVLLVFSTVFAAIEGSFQASVTVWAAEEAVRTGSAPEFYEPLRHWANGSVQIVYMSFLLTALLLFSWSAVRTGLLASWIGWAALTLSLLSFPLYFFVLGAPLIAFVTPLLFGIGLLLRG
jgi:hypothetical protein